VTSDSEFHNISDSEFDNLPRHQQAELMREYARTQGRDLSAHEAGLLAGWHAANRVAELESRAAAAHQGYATRARGLSACEITPPWEIADPGIRPPAGRQSQLEAG
jgi:hypothetical protein